MSNFTKKLRDEEDKKLFKALYKNIKNKTLRKYIKFYQNNNKLGVTND